MTKIPTAGWSVADRQFMWFMSVKQWGAAGQWDVNYAEIAYSGDNGNSWHLSGTRWPGNSNFIQVTFAEQSDELLIWGIPAGRLGGVKLARVRPSRFLDQTAYSYYTGTGWSADEAEGMTINDGETVYFLMSQYIPYNVFLMKAVFRREVNGLSEEARPQAPESCRLGWNYPNPFNAQTRISFDLPTSEWISLKIYNAQGQRIRVLLNGHTEAGHHTLVWDGRDNANLQAGSGIYIFRLAGPGFVQNRKVLLIR